MDAEVGVLSASRALTWRDRVAHWKARWGMGRMRMSVTPGLYRLGKPDRQAPVFVTANYKLSFDAFRTNLAGLDAWILVHNVLMSARVRFFKWPTIAPRSSAAIPASNAAPASATARLAPCWCRPVWAAQRP